MSNLLLSAARMALDMRPTLVAREKGESKDIYTDADVGVERMLFDALHDPANGVEFVGEETVFDFMKTRSLAEVFAGDAYIVDPIDGTLNYLNGLPQWAMSIGYMRGGRIVEGAVILPDLGEILVSENGAVYRALTGLSENRAAGPSGIQLSDAPLSFTKLAPPRINFPDRHTLFVSSGAPGEHERRPRMPFHINRSSVFSAVKVLTGNYWGYRSKAKIWDLAGCIALFNSAGVPMYCALEGGLSVLPDTVESDYWVDLLSARHDIFFVHNKEHALRWL